MVCHREGDGVKRGRSKVIVLAFGEGELLHGQLRQAVLTAAHGAGELQQQRVKLSRLIVGSVVGLGERGDAQRENGRGIGLVERCRDGFFVDNLDAGDGRGLPSGIGGRARQRGARRQQMPVIRRVVEHAPGEGHVLRRYTAAVGKKGVFLKSEGVGALVSRNGIFRQHRCGRSVGRGLHQGVEKKTSDGCINRVGQIEGVEVATVSRTGDNQIPLSRSRRIVDFYGGKGRRAQPAVFPASADEREEQHDHQYG